MQTETTKATTGFRKYDKLQRQGHRYTRGIEEGTVLVFPKIDGTNASVWADADGNVYAGSRNRELAEGDDNQGFRAWLMSDAGEAVRAFAIAFPHLILYGEWLVPHTIKGYEEGAWRRFYIFDVFSRSDEFRGYVPYDTYAPLFEAYNAEFPDNTLDFLFPIARFENPTGAEVKATTEGNTVLMTGEQIGEGVVVKNYEWRNADSDRVWGKYVRSEFKAGMKQKCAPRPTVNVEPAIAEEFVTPTLVQKTLAKVLGEVADSEEQGGMMERDELLATFRGRIIPQLLGRVWFDILDEEMASIVKKFKRPTIDFKALQTEVSRVVKELTPELF